MTRSLPFPLSRFQDIWLHPLCEPFRRHLPALAACSHWPSPDDWNAWAEASPQFQEGTGGLRFVAEIRPGSRRRRREKKEARQQAVGLRSYEARVIEQAEVATRPEHPHDFFNAMIWLCYPASKSRLHQIAYQLQQKAGGGSIQPGQRSREADSLTCFDEGGVYFRCRALDDLDAIRSLFASRRDEDKIAFCRAHPERFGIFGHGLLEGLLVHQLDSVQVSCLLVEDGGEGNIDRSLAEQIGKSVEQRDHWGTVPFAALWSMK